MKTLIAYYSRTGKNERVAKDIQKGLGCDIEKIEDMKNRGGVLGFITGGKDAFLKKTTEIGKIQKNPEDYELIILMSPVWSGLIVPAIRTYVSENREKLNNVAFVSVSGAGEKGNGKALTEFESFLGKKCVVYLLLAEKELDNESYKNKIANFTSALK